MGFSKFAPPPTLAVRVHSRKTFQGRASIDPRLPHLERVPSLSFLPTSTGFSAHCPAGLLHPAAGHGVRRVLGSRPPVPVRANTFRDLRAFALLDGATPFGAFPSPVAVPRHRDTVPSRRCRPLRRPPTETLPPRPGLTSGVRSTSGLRATTESVVTSRRCRRAATRCSPGLVSLLSTPSTPPLHGTPQGGS
jgi:hypothetical protein